MLNEWQRLDTIDPAEGKRYMHQYNFPPYCTGEVGRMGAPKRREIGHGALAERALLPVLPNEDDFPYAIRVVSEVPGVQRLLLYGLYLRLLHLPSWTLACPSSAPVSGVAMGLIKEGDDVVVLTDIQGHRGLPGRHGLQSVPALPTRHHCAADGQQGQGPLRWRFWRRALKQAHEGRAFILDAMLEQIPEPRAEMRETAPRIETIKIPVDKIRDVIGSGGKVVRGIQEETGVSIDIQEDGTIHVGATDGNAMEAAKSIILGIVKEPEVGEEFDGEVVGIKDFGAFVEAHPL